MLRVGFEPTILAGERLQIYALDRMSTGTGLGVLLKLIIIIIIIIQIGMKNQSS